jgi:hypothetical protein
MEPWIAERLEALPVASQIELCGTYQFAVEPLLDVVWDEVERLGALHHAEMIEHHLGEQYNPDKEGRQIDCATGRLFACIIRDADKDMVGYALIYIFKNRNSQEIQVREDAMFIQKEHRRGRLFMRFNDYVHNLARKVGATKSRIQVCVGARNARYVKSIGYREIATIMEMNL